MGMKQPKRQTESKPGRGWHRVSGNLCTARGDWALDPEDLSQTTESQSRPWAWMLVSLSSYFFYPIGIELGPSSWYACMLVCWKIKFPRFWQRAECPIPPPGGVVSGTHPLRQNPWNWPKFECGGVPNWAMPHMYGGLGIFSIVQKQFYSSKIICK